MRYCGNVWNFVTIHPLVFWAVFQTYINSVVKHTTKTVFRRVIQQIVQTLLDFCFHHVTCPRFFRFAPDVSVLQGTLWASVILSEPGVLPVVFDGIHAIHGADGQHVSPPVGGTRR